MVFFPAVRISGTIGLFSKTTVIAPGQAASKTLSIFLSTKANFLAISISVIITGTGFVSGRFLILKSRSIQSIFKASTPKP